MESFTISNHLQILPTEYHYLVNGKRHSPSHVDERPSQKNVVASVDVQNLKLHIELCRTHLNDEVYYTQCVSLQPIKSPHIDLVVFKLSLVKF